MGILIQMSCFWTIRNFIEKRAYFQSPEIFGRPQPQTISTCGRGRCGRKIMRLKYMVTTSRKFRANGQNTYFLCIIYSLTTFSLVNIRTPWGDAPSLVPCFSEFIVDDRYIFCLSICWAVWSYALPIDGGRRNAGEIWGFFPPSF